MVYTLVSVLISFLGWGGVLSGLLYSILLQTFLSLHAIWVLAKML